MSNLIRCPQCEMPYLPGEAVFCGTCGTKLPNPSDVKRQLSRIENAPRPYKALRFVSALIIAGGWMVIIGGWALTIFYYWLGTTAQGNPLSEIPFIGSMIFPLIFLFIDTLFGVIIIGAGQVYAAILDIRDDMNATMQYVRYGLKKSQG